MSQTKPALEAPSLGATFRSDFLASIVVFLVALPLCIGIAVAVGVSPARALITGIVGGLAVGWIAGSPLQVSGPAASLFVIVADVIVTRREQYLQLNPSLDDGSGEASAMAFALAALGVSVFLAGVMQLTAGKLRIGRWFRAVSPAVIKGLLSGIGALILVSQFHVMLDHTAMWGDAPAHGGLQYLATIPEAIMKCFTGGDRMHHLAATIGVVTIGTIVAWQKFAPKKISFIPGPLVGILAATVVVLVADFNVVQLQIPSNMLSDVTLPSVAWGGLLIDPATWISAFVIGLVGSAATLLTAAAIDDMSRDIGVKTDYDRELSAQGVGNMICGTLGALPMTGVIVRSSANVQAGARTRLSTIPARSLATAFHCSVAPASQLHPKISVRGAVGLHRTEAAQPGTDSRVVEGWPRRSRDLPDHSNAHRYRRFADWCACGGRAVRCKTASSVHASSYRSRGR